jgi:hypothetical protein
MANDLIQFGESKQTMSSLEIGEPLTIAYKRLK